MILPTTDGARHGATGARFGERYEVRRVLGEGGMGVVYEAFDRVRATRVALKTMRRLDAAGLYRFKNEFRALVDVSHPNLASLHELDSVGDQTFFTMEYVEGVDFLAYVSRGSATVAGTDSTVSAPIALMAVGAERGIGAPRPPRVGPLAATLCDVRRLRESLVQLVDGVAALHANGKLHRDLKPSNVLVTPEGRVVVLDFGLVANLERVGAETVEHHIVGTPEYMSPEQASADELSEASDAYSIGVIMYEALAGELPFQGPPRKILSDKQQIDPPPPSERARGVPADLDALCVDLLRRAPAQRPKLSAVLLRLGGAPTTQRTAARPTVAPTMPTLSVAFVGREQHVRTLTAAFESARAGLAVVAYVHGSSGMGKSLLVRRFLDALTQRDEAIVLAGRCYERESVPYKALDSIVDALSRHFQRLARHDVEAILPLEIHALTRLFPVLDRVEAVNGAPRRAHEIPDPQELRRRAATALRELFDRMASRRPVVLWIDDLQWGDVDSAALIAELLRPPTPPPVLLVVSYRSEDANSPLVAAMREVHARDVGDPRGVDVREIEVGPLDRSEARDLALALLGGDTPANRAQAAVIAGEAHGSPFFVDELVHYVQSGEAIEWSASGPTLRLDDVLHARVRAMPDDARRFLEVIAVAGRPLSRLAAASAADLEGERENTALALLRTGKLVRSLRTGDQYDLETYHDRIRETVVSRLDPPSRAARHLRVAQALVARGGADPEALVVHFREGGELRKSAEFAAIAAAKAVEALAFNRAASLWRRALELPQIAPRIARELHWKLGDALANAGRGAEAAEAYLIAAEGASAGNGLELRRRAAEQLLRSGRIADGMRALRDVLSAVGMSLPTGPWMILLALVFYEIRLRLRGLRFKVRDLSQLSATELRRVDICWSVGATLGIVQPLPAKIFQKRHLLLALAAGEPTRIVRGIAIEATTAALPGVPARARTDALLREATALATPLGDAYCSAWIFVARGLSAYLEGRFREALEQCDRAAEHFRDGCSGAMFEIASLVVFASQALFHLGEMAELSRRIPTFTQEARQRGDLYLLTNARIGWINASWLASDDPDRAERELDEAMAQWGAPDQQLQQYYELVARVQIELYRGRGRAAHARIDDRRRALARAHLFRVQTVRIFVWHLRARAALGAIAAREVEGAVANGFEAAALRDARRIARERLRWSTPLGKLVEAAVFARRGDRARSLTLLAEAVDDFDASDMALWSAAAKRRRGELFGGDAGRALVDEADAKFRAQGVKDPRNYCAMLAPGFPPPAIGASSTGAPA